MTHFAHFTVVSKPASKICKGPDPADPSRILIRKIVQINDNTYGYEETTITKREGNKPAVHSKMSRIGDWDLREEVST